MPYRIIFDTDSAVFNDDAAALAMLWIGRGPQGWLLLDPQSLAAFLPMRLP